MKINVRYYDGITNQAHDAQLVYHDDQHLSVYYQNQRQLYALKDVEYIASVGHILPCLDLPHDARIEFLSHDIPQWLNIKHKTLLSRVQIVEKSWRWLAVSFISVIAVIFSTFKWGIPALAYMISINLPDNTLQTLGNQSQDMIIKSTAPSQLSNERQQQILQLYQQLQHDKKATVLFREGKSIGANALAIPNHTIVITDELVALTQNDQELLGVLAHEQAHLDEKHSLQQILRGLGMSLFYMMITGDTTDLITNFPIMMMSAQYSQKFELDADKYAVKEMQRLNISPQHLANFLQRLDEQHGDNHSSWTNLFASHPVTSERIAQIERLQ